MRRFHASGREPAVVLFFVLGLTAWAILLGAHTAQAADTNKAAAKAAAKPFRDCPECPQMVPIPPGEFIMGADGGEADRPEGPPHHVRIARPFAAGRYEVTNREWAAFVKATAYVMPQGCNDWDSAHQTYHRFPERNWRDPGYGRPPRDDEPVVCFRWNDAKAYVGWLAKRTGKPYRLLTEAEWEYIARAGSQTAYPWGDDPAGACAYANVLDASADPGFPGDPATCADGFPGVAPVGQFKPNAFGLYDVIGNVWEWVEDCYRAPYPASAPIDGSALEVDGPCELRSVRGGSWRTGMFRQRPAWRGRDPQDTQVTNIFGLRVARDLR